MTFFLYKRKHIPMQLDADPFFLVLAAPFVNVFKCEKIIVILYDGCDDKEDYDDVDDAVDGDLDDDDNSGYFSFRAPRDELRQLVKAGGGLVSHQARIAQVNNEEVALRILTPPLCHFNTPIYLCEATSPHNFVYQRPI